MEYKNQLQLEYAQLEAKSEKIDTYSTAVIEDFVREMDEIVDEPAAYVEEELMKYTNWESSREGKVITVRSYDLDGDGEWDGFTETKIDVLDFTKLEDLDRKVELCFDL